MKSVVDNFQIENVVSENFKWWKEVDDYLTHEKSCSKEVIYLHINWPFTLKYYEIKMVILRATVYASEWTASVGHWEESSVLGEKEQEK